MIGKTLGHYRVGEQLGRGGMGEVYLADDLNLNRKVALKFLPDAFTGDPERMARFEREAKLLASLNHPNIAAIYGLEQAEGKRFLVLELVEGDTLAQRLSKGALSVEEALGVCRQIAEGLEAAHEKGVIHRDLKPANVMITAGDNVKILDFGLAKALSDETQSVDSSQSPMVTEAMTRPGVILGTAAYMSPEQAKGKAVDKRADIWAFGCILYEYLTGKRAFEGETVTETLAAVLTREPEWEKVPAKVRPLLRRCLEKDPKKRVRDIGEAMAWIEIAPESAPAKRPWLAWSIAAVLIAAFAVLSFVHFGERPPAPAEPVRFQIALPEKESLDWTGWFAVSPDGRHLAFSAVGSDDTARLWVRALDSLEAKPLIGTESTDIPWFFWSPDSRFIAYDTGSKLKKIDVTGGLVQTICDISEYPMGGSWNRDGEIIFGTWLGKSLMRVSAAGGVPSPLAKPDPSRQITWQNYPNFLPDGRHFLFLQDSTIPENRGVYIGSLDFKPEEQGSKLLSATQSGLFYVPSQDSGPGQILFLRQQTLMAQQFDEKRLKLVGEPMPVGEHVASFNTNGYFSASLNGVLVYRRGEVYAKQELVWMDRAGNHLESACPSGEYSDFRLSPDEKSIVFDRVEDSNRDIWIRDLHRSVNTRLTFDPRTDDWPIWSPDGLRILWPSDRGGSVDLYIKEASGAGQEQLLIKVGTGRAGGSDWSRDGKFILYDRSGDAGALDIWVAPQFGERRPFPYLQSQFEKHGAVFSPDGHWIAYESNESGRNEVYVQAFPLTREKKQISNGGGSGSAWRKDGAELFYVAADRKLMAVPILASAKTFEPGIAKALFQIPGGPNNWAYQSSGDGRRFLVAKPSGEAAPFTVVLNWQAELKK